MDRYDLAGAFLIVLIGAVVWIGATLLIGFVMGQPPEVFQETAAWGTLFFLIFLGPELPKILRRNFKGSEGG